MKPVVKLCLVFFTKNFKIVVLFNTIIKFSST